MTCRVRLCVEMETRCGISIWRTFGRIQWHVIPEPRITLQGAATWWIHCHDSRATCYISGCSHLTKSMSWTCHIAGCQNSLRHIENRFSPYFIILFLMQFRLWRAARLSYRLRYTCLQSSSSCYASKWIELAWLTKNVLHAVESLQHHDQRSSSLTLIGPQIGTRSIFLWRKS